MRRYETIIIIDPDLTEESRAPIFERFNDIFKQQNGFLIETDDWGVKKLAYEIKKRTRGYYTRLDYCGGGDLVNELERFCRIDDKVLKYMTVVLDKAADLDGIKASLEKAEAEAEAKVKAENEAKDASKAEDEKKDETIAEAETAVPEEKKTEAKSSEEE